MPTFNISASTKPFGALASVTVNAVDDSSAKEAAIDAYINGGITEWSANGAQLLGFFLFNLSPRYIIKLNSESYNILLESSKYPASINTVITAENEEEALLNLIEDPNKVWNWNGIPIESSNFEINKIYSSSTVLKRAPIINSYFTDLLGNTLSIIYVGQSYYFKVEVSYVDTIGNTVPASGAVTIANGNTFNIINGIGSILYTPDSTSKQFLSFIYEGYQDNQVEILPSVQSENIRIFRGSTVASISSAVASVNVNELFLVTISKDNTSRMNFTITSTIGMITSTIRSGYMTGNSATFYVKISSAGSASVKVIFSSNDDYNGDDSTPITITVT